MMHTRRFLVTPDSPLFPILQSAAQEIRKVRDKAFDLAVRLGATKMSNDRRTSVLTGVVFPDPKSIPRDFTQPARRTMLSFPKKGTAWAKVFAEQTPAPNVQDLIEANLEFPRFLSFKTADGVKGETVLMTRVGHPCDAEWLSLKGPFSILLPDLHATAKDLKARGDKVARKDLAYAYDFPGLKPVTENEWTLICAEFDVKEELRSLKNPVPKKDEPPAEPDVRFSNFRFSSYIVTNGKGEYWQGVEDGLLPYGRVVRGFTRATQYNSVLEAQDEFKGQTYADDVLEWLKTAHIAQLDVNVKFNASPLNLG